MAENTNPTNGAGASGGTDPTVVAGAAFPPPPPIPSGEEVYDTLMSKIEPELTTAQLPFLKDKYKDETPEAAKIRAERYQKAFAEYDKQYAEYTTAQQKGLQSYQKQFMQGIQTMEDSAQASKLDEISSAISSL